MKSMRNSLMIALLILSVFACGDDEPVIPSEQNEIFERLSGRWTMGQNGSIRLDDVDISLNYPSLGIFFDNGTYNTFGAGSLFNANGTWAVENEQDQIIRLDGTRDINIIKLNESEFNFTFTFDGAGGVVFGAAGNYNITLEK